VLQLINNYSVNLYSVRLLCLTVSLTIHTYPRILAWDLDPWAGPVCVYICMYLTILQQIHFTLMYLTVSPTASDLAVSSFVCCCCFSLRFCRLEIGK